MSKEDSIKVSLKKKIALYEKYLLIAQMAEKFANDKRVLRAMKRIAKDECRILQRSKYPMETADLQEGLMFITELQNILKALVRASAFERYRLASNALSEFLVRLEKKCRETESSVQGKTTAREALDAAIDKARSIGEVIGKGVEEIKKTVKDIGSK